MMKNFKKNGLYVLIHKRMYFIGSSDSFKIHLADESDVFVSVTSSVAREFLDYTIPPDVLLNIYTILCYKSGKCIV